MKRLLRTYLPSSAIAFTIVILFSVIFNLILGKDVYKRQPRITPYSGLEMKPLII